MASVTRLGNFRKNLIANFLTKEALYCGDFLAIFRDISLCVKYVVATFWAAFRKFGLLFILTFGHSVCYQLTTPSAAQI